VPEHDGRQSAGDRLLQWLAHAGARINRERAEAPALGPAYGWVFGLVARSSQRAFRVGHDPTIGPFSICAAASGS